MRANGTTFRLQFVALLVLFSVSVQTAASAQTVPVNPSTLDAVLMPGTTVWITDSTGREERTRIVDVAGDVVTTSTGEETRRIRKAEVTRVSARRADSVWNGALIGAGVGVASGLFFCSLMEPWETCRGDISSMSRVGALGAGIGIGIDALIRGRKTLYEAVPGSRQLRAAPIVDRRARGLQVSLNF
jgi:hypothetical protein